MDGHARSLLCSEDGSHTVVVEGTALSYHSTRGALQESRHVFLEAGLRAVSFRGSGSLQVLEMGLGTGLNAFLTALESQEKKLPVQYHALEKFPLEPALTERLNYPQFLGHAELFRAIHKAPWNRPVSLYPFFQLEKLQSSLLDFHPDNKFHLIYFDAFAPESQPELWTQEVFEHLGQGMYAGGLLTTYCSKGTVRRALQAAGWNVEKLPGPPGKREIVRAHWG